MGYRSNVRSIIYGEPDKVQALWTKHILAGNEMLKDHADLIERYKIEVEMRGHPEHMRSVIELNVEAWKWYEGYEHVDGWHDMLNDAADNFELQYEFVRVGEEEGDIERQSSDNAEGYLYTTTEIITDLPKRIEEHTDEQVTESQG